MRKLVLLTVLATALTLAIPSAARPPTEAPARTWYGWQTLTSDGAALALGLSGIPAESFVPPVLGAVGYVVGAPMIHAAHGHPIRALVSVGLRLVLTVGLGGLTYLALKPDGPTESSGVVDPDHLQAGGTGFLVGALGGIAAIVVDAATAFEEPPKRQASVGISRVPGGTTLGLSGRF